MTGFELCTSVSLFAAFFPRRAHAGKPLEHFRPTKLDSSENLFAPRLRHVKAGVLEEDSRPVTVACEPLDYLRIDDRAGRSRVCELIWRFPFQHLAVYDDPVEIVAGDVGLGDAHCGHEVVDRALTIVYDIDEAAACRVGEQGEVIGRHEAVNVCCPSRRMCTMKNRNGNLRNHDLHENGLAVLLTIGYGGKRTSEEFVELLHRYGVKYLADVRTRPFSKFRPEFSKDALAAFLRRHGITYVYMGDNLGGLPSDPTCYTDGKVDYRKVRERAWFDQGLARLENGWRSGHHIAIMCAELEPDRCHRSKLIGEALIARGIAVGHIDEKGGVIAHEAVMARLNAGQATLFGSEYTSRRTYRPLASEESE